MADDSAEFTVIGSRFHMSKETTEFIESLKEIYPDTRIISAGSSLKFCLVAEGSADYISASRLP